MLSHVVASVVGAVLAFAVYRAVRFVRMRRQDARFAAHLATRKAATVWQLRCPVVYVDGQKVAHLRDVTIGITPMHTTIVAGVVMPIQGSGPDLIAAVLSKTECKILVAVDGKTYQTVGTIHNVTVVGSVPASFCAGTFAFDGTALVAEQSSGAPVVA